MTKHPLTYYPKQLGLLGRLCWYLYIIEIFPDGDGVGIIFIKVNPLTWLTILCLLLVIFFFEGINGIIKMWRSNKLYLNYSDYWEKHSDKVGFIPRW